MICVVGDGRGNKLSSAAKPEGWEHRSKSFEEMPISVWQQIVGINLFGTVKVTQAVVPYMAQQEFGRIVNISSDVATTKQKCILITSFNSISFSPLILPTINK